MLQPGSMAAGECSHGGGVDQVVMGPSDRELELHTTPRSWQGYIGEGASWGFSPLIKVSP